MGRRKREPMSEGKRILRMLSRICWAERYRKCLRQRRTSTWDKVHMNAPTTPITVTERKPRKYVEILVKPR